MIRPQPTASSAPRSIRTRVMFWSLVLVAVSVAGSGLALIRVSQVNEALHRVNRIAVPLGRLFTQMQADADALRREQDRNLGFAHQSDPHWKPRPVPTWILDVLTHEIGRARELVTWDPSQAAEMDRLAKGFGEVRSSAAALYAALDPRDPAPAQETERLHAKMVYLSDQWRKDVQVLASAQERNLAAAFTQAQRKTAEVETGLQILLAAAFLLSALSLWNARSALGPLAQLSRYARELAERGLSGGDHLKGYPDLPLSRDDEIGALAREMKSMATTLRERVQAEEAARDRLKSAEHLAAIGRMSAQVAHEVRNPLHSIGLEAELALEATESMEAEGVQAERARESIRSILRSVERLEKITGNYLKMSRISQGRRTSVDLADVLEASLATYAPVFQAQKVQVDWKLIGNGPFVVQGERELLENALGNLVRNALQALEGVSVASNSPPATILLELARLPDGMVSLSVKDNGPGVSVEVRDRLFTPFVTTRPQGTGLGLSFVKKVAEDHGGAIRYCGDETRSGAKFEIRLPTGVSLL